MPHPDQMDLAESPRRKSWYTTGVRWNNNMMPFRGLKISSKGQNVEGSIQFFQFSTISECFSKFLGAREVAQFVVEDCWQWLHGYLRCIPRKSSSQESRTIYKPLTLWWTNIAMENHHFSWENPLFLWPCSIAFCMFTRPGTSTYYIFFVGLNKCRFHGKSTNLKELELPSKLNSHWQNSYRHE